MITEAQKDLINGLIKKMQFEIDAYRSISALDRVNALAEDASETVHRDEYRIRNSRFTIQKAILSNLEIQLELFSEILKYEFDNPEAIYADLLASVNLRIEKDRQYLKGVDLSDEGKIILLMKTSAPDDLSAVIECARNSDIERLAQKLHEKGCVPEGIRHQSLERSQIRSYDRVRHFILFNQHELHDNR